MLNIAVGLARVRHWASRVGSSLLDRAVGVGSVLLWPAERRATMRLRNMDVGVCLSSRRLVWASTASTIFPSSVVILSAPYVWSVWYDSLTTAHLEVPLWPPQCCAIVAPLVLTVTTHYLLAHGMYKTADIRF